MACLIEWFRLITIDGKHHREPCEEANWRAGKGQACYTYRQEIEHSHALPDYRALGREWASET